MLSQLEHGTCAMVISSFGKIDLDMVEELCYTTEKVFQQKKSILKFTIEGGNNKRQCCNWD